MWPYTYKLFLKAYLLISVGMFLTGFVTTIMASL